MPYEYRKLTPQEKEKVIRIRKENGYPVHTPPHPFREEGFYLITAACFEHMSVMDSPNRRSEFEVRMLDIFKSSTIETSAWVILPNHYHVLVGVSAFEQISVAIKRLHNGTSYEWNKADGLTGKRRVWYHFADRCIRNERHYQQAMNYIHINPVKHSLVDTPYEWVWSSLGLYLEDKGHDWLREQWRNFPPESDLLVE